MKLCVNSKWLLNPALKNLYSYHNLVHTEKGYIPVSYINKGFAFNPDNWRTALYSASNPADWYFIHNIQKIHCFIEVGCNECANCRNSRLNDIVQRMQFEALCYNSTPLFLVLTYDNKHVPEKLLYRDIQLFNKRLRHKYKYTFFCSGEHGTHRPHWHMMLFSDWKDFNYKDIEALQKEFSQVWQNGFVYIEQVGFRKTYANGFWKDCNIGNAFRYTAKYVAKDNNLVRWSKGLGKKYANILGTNVQIYSKNPNNELYFIDCLGQRQKVIVNTWLLDCWFGNMAKDSYIYRKCFRYLQALDIDAPFNKDWYFGFRYDKKLTPAERDFILKNTHNLPKNPLQYCFNFLASYDYSLNDHFRNKRALYVEKLDNKITHDYRLQSDYINTKKLHLQLQRQIL